MSFMIDSYSQIFIWFKYSSNNQIITTYQFFLNIINEFIRSLQVYCDIGIENMLITKYMAILHSEKLREYISSRLVCNTYIERFYRECNTNIIDFLIIGLQNQKDLDYLTYQIKLIFRFYIAST